MEYYQGDPNDTLEDHISKCPACKQINTIVPGCIVPHGQVMKYQYAALFSMICEVPGDTEFILKDLKGTKPRGANEL